MRVERGRRRDGGAMPRGVAASAGKERGTPFVEEISRAEDRAVERDQERLFAAIEEQARVLARKQTVTELTKYRELVHDFMKLAVEQSLKVTEIRSARFIENRKVYLVARQVEQKLLDLAEAIREGGDGRAMAIAAATSEIRGLLMDLKA